MSSSRTDLAQAVEDLNPAGLNYVLDLLFLSKLGSARVKRDRVLVLATGAARRLRLGILDLALHCIQSIEDLAAFGPPVDADFHALGATSGVLELRWFDDFIDSVHGVVPPFTKFPAKLFSDLPRSHEDGSTYQSIADYQFPDQAELRLVGGVAEGDAAAAAGPGPPAAEFSPAELAELRKELTDKISSDVLSSLQVDIAENRFGATSEASMQTLRRTLAFDISPTEFFFSSTMIFSAMVLASPCATWTIRSLANYFLTSSSITISWRRRTTST